MQNPDPPARLEVDLRRWPIVILTHSGRPSDEAMRAHLAEIEQRVLARGEPFVQVIDQSLAERPDAFQRGLIADHQRRMADAYRSLCRGEVYVSPSAALRGAMRAVFWLARPEYPHAFVATRLEALQWASERLPPAPTPEA